MEYPFYWPSAPSRVKKQKARKGNEHRMNPMSTKTTGGNNE
jgi:hypothetical protein